MTLEERIRDERECATYAALDRMCDEKEIEIRELACELAAVKAENSILRDEVERLTVEVSRLELEAWKS